MRQKRLRHSLKQIFSIRERFLNKPEIETDAMNNQKKSELRDDAPELSGLSRDDGFTTPHNYFRELPDRVFEKIVAEEAAPSPIVSWLRHLLRPRYSVAIASVLLLIVAGIWYGNMQEVNDPLASITQDEAFAYVMENLHEFTSEDLASAGLLSGWEEDALSPLSDEDVESMIDFLQEDEFLDELILN
jgi:hypothetical protein